MSRSTGDRLYIRRFRIPEKSAESAAAKPALRFPQAGVHEDAAGDLVPKKELHEMAGRGGGPRKKTIEARSEIVYGAGLWAIPTRLPFSMRNRVYRENDALCGATFPVRRCRARGFPLVLRRDAILNGSASE